MTETWHSSTKDRKTVDRALSRPKNAMEPYALQDRDQAKKIIWRNDTIDEGLLKGSYMGFRTSKEDNDYALL